MAGRFLSQPNFLYHLISLVENNCPEISAIKAAGSYVASVQTPYPYSPGLAGLAPAGTPASSVSIPAVAATSFAIGATNVVNLATQASVVVPVLAPVIATVAAVAAPVAGAITAVVNVATNVWNRIWGQ